jgi:hypothetical protein
MALNSASNVLRETDNPPLTNNNAPISGAQYDQNVINIYDDLVALNSGGDVPAYDPLKEYDDTVNKFVSYGGEVWLYINATATIGTTPVEGLYWTQVPPSVLAHPKNQDSHLDLGGDDEVSATEIRAMLDGIGSGTVIYKGRLAQAGTSAPVVTDYINSTGLTIVGGYGAVGQYSITGFTGETFITSGNYEIQLTTCGLQYDEHISTTPFSDTGIGITTKDAGTNANDILRGVDGGGNQVYQVLTITKY